MNRGTLYGVSVGPGAGDLMTIRALNCLKNADCIAIPRKDKFSPSVAWGIAKDMVGDINDQERLFLNFPMTKNPDLLKPAWDIAFEEIKDRLDAGKDVAFITAGDAFVYSTFIYIYNHAKKYWPEINVEVVAGVSSISAVPIVAGIPLADGQERVAIIPASYKTDDLRLIFQMFDTIVLMKVSSVMNEIVCALEAEDLLDKAVYVAKATMKEEQIVWDIKSIKDDQCVYFSMIVVSKKERSGILEGRKIANKEKSISEQAHEVSN